MEENLTPKEIKTYLDKAITNWRKTRDTSTEPVEVTMATHYIDAFQSVRATLFGETLPAEEEPDGG